MSESRQNLVDGLVSDLAPVAPPPSLTSLTLAWLFGAFAWVIVMTWLVGPLRPGVGQQLLENPRFLFETLLGFSAIVAATSLLFRSALPGRSSPFAVRAATALVGLWLLSFLAGLLSPALEPSMLGKRPYCMYETVVYALPPLLAALYWLQRLYPLRPMAAAALAGLAAGLLPAWYMQVACMHEPLHILLFHVLPGLSVALLSLPLMRYLPLSRVQSR